MLAAWMHDLDPCALHAFGRCLVRWYGLSYIAGFAAAWLIIRTLTVKGRTKLRSPALAGDLVFAVAVGAVVGGRLGYVLLYRPTLLWSFDASVPWWGLLRINDGGMASHGGMVGVIVACALVARREKLPFFHLTDLVALAAPAGLFMGRMANFINGELLGRIVAAPGEPAPRWAVRYPQELLSPAHAPTLTGAQELELGRLAYEAAPDAETLNQQLVALIEAARAGGEVAERLEPLLSARHPSQLYQAAAEGIVLGAVLWAVFLKTKRVGVVSALFLIVYGALRIITEHWRLPDDHLATPRPLGLSRGQWYSAAMILAGALILWRVRRKTGPGETGPASAESDSQAA